MTPKENFDFVNAYFKQVSPVIRDHRGFIIKYLGDGMMAVFPGGADDAVRAGIDKLKQVAGYNRRRQQQGYQPIKVGLGVHTGQMMVGIVGEEGRLQGDAFSDNVNLTQRIETLTRFYGAGLIISEVACHDLTDPTQFQLRFLDKVQVKGKQEPVSIIEVLDGEPEPERALKLKTLDNFAAGVQHYQRREFAAAQTCFNRVLADNPADKAAELYLRRLHRLVERGVSADWTGVEAVM